MILKRIVTEIYLFFICRFLFSVRECFYLHDLVWANPVLRFTSGYSYLFRGDIQKIILDTWLVYPHIVVDGESVVHIELLLLIKGYQNVLLLIFIYYSMLSVRIIALKIAWIYSIAWLNWTLVNIKLERYLKFSIGVYNLIRKLNTLRWISRNVFGIEIFAGDQPLNSNIFKVHFDNFLRNLNQLFLSTKEC